MTYKDWCNYEIVAGDLIEEANELDDGSWVGCNYILQQGFSNKDADMLMPVIMKFKPCFIQIMNLVDAAFSNRRETAVKDLVKLIELYDSIRPEGMKIDSNWVNFCFDEACWKIKYGAIYDFENRKKIACADRFILSTIQSIPKEKFSSFMGEYAEVYKVFTGLNRARLLGQSVECNELCCYRPYYYNQGRSRKSNFSGLYDIVSEVCGHYDVCCGDMNGRYEQTNEMNLMDSCGTAVGRKKRMFEDFNSNGRIDRNYVFDLNDVTVVGKGGKVLYRTFIPIKILDPDSMADLLKVVLKDYEGKDVVVLIPDANYIYNHNWVKDPYDQDEILSVHKEYLAQYVDFVVEHKGYCF